MGGRGGGRDPGACTCPVMCSIHGTSCLSYTSRSYGGSADKDAIKSIESKPYLKGVLTSAETHGTTESIHEPPGTDLPGTSSQCPALLIQPPLGLALTSG